MLSDSDDPESDTPTLRNQACNPSSSEFWIIQALCVSIFGLIGSLAVCNSTSIVVPGQNHSVLQNMTNISVKDRVV